MRTRVAPMPAIAQRHAALLAFILLGIWLVLTAFAPGAPRPGPDDLSPYAALHPHVLTGAPPLCAGSTPGAHGAI